MRKNGIPCLERIFTLHDEIAQDVLIMHASWNSAFIHNRMHDISVSYNINGQTAQG